MTPQLLTQYLQLMNAYGCTHLEAGGIKLTVPTPRAPLTSILSTISEEERRKVEEAMGELKDEGLGELTEEALTEIEFGSGVRRVDNGKEKTQDQIDDDLLFAHETFSDFSADAEILGTYEGNSV
jgi:hypothetical protein